MFSDAQALTGTAVSQNIIDLGASRKIFGGRQVSLLLCVDSGAVGTGTYAVALQTSTDAAFTSPVVVSSQSIAAADLAAGKQAVIGFPISSSLQRYVRLNYTLGGTSPAVTLTALLQPTDMIQDYSAYQDASTIS
jgi:hypothetical protein